MATVGGWRVDGDELEWKMLLRRGRWGRRKDEEIANAKQECQEKSKEKAGKE